MHDPVTSNRPDYSCAELAHYEPEKHGVVHHLLRHGVAKARIDFLRWRFLHCRNGLAFGTGSHPTTRLCLRWLDANIKGGEDVLDYGCGSGILAIAALKLGASSAIGVDVDAQAVQASRDNAVVNQADAKFYLPDRAPKFQADIVVANILTNPLKVLAPLLANATRQGGRIVLSGILSEQAEDVMKIYAQWFNLVPPIMDEGWACVSGIKRLGRL